MKKLLLFFACFFMFFAPASADEQMDAIKNDRYNAGCNHHPYTAPEFKDTKAPKGYKPFYLSHYGRHGSRYLIGENVYARVNEKMAQLHEAGLLTAEGEALREDLIKMAEAHDGEDGILTQVGSMEHQGIGSRLYKRSKKLFNQKDRDEILVISSPITRCVQSAFNFTGSIKAGNPDLKISLYSGDKYLRYLANWANNDELSKRISEVSDSLRDALMTKPGELIFTDADKVQEVLGKETLTHFVYSLINKSSIARCLDIDVDPFKHFTDEELFAHYAAYSARSCGYFRDCLDADGFRDSAVARPLLKDFVEKADEALKGGHKCADLRFGHDSGIGPLLSLIGVEGYDTKVSLANAYKEWPSYEMLPMGTNLQMIFYKNRKGDILVKLLRNEIETTIPAVSSFDGPYYKWKDLRAYFAKKCKMD